MPYSLLLTKVIDWTKRKKKKIIYKFVSTCTIPTSRCHYLLDFHPSAFNLFQSKNEFESSHQKNVISTQNTNQGKKSNLPELTQHHFLLPKKQKKSVTRLM